MLPLLLLAAVAPAARAQDTPPELQSIAGGWKVQAAYAKWLSVWRDKYVPNNHTFIPEVPDASLPAALRGVETKVMMSAGGAAGGVVTEGMGYALMVEGIQAYNGDQEGLKNALSLTRSWLGMVFGPSKTLRGGGDGTVMSATKVGTWPYGVSAIESHNKELGPAGVATWKYPTDLCLDAKHPHGIGCQGSAADADQDAILGMIYLAAALQYPEDFVDMVVRTVISFASADLGFPDLYRTLPDGTKVFVPKGGSDWGGELSTKGPLKTSHVPWCYSPGYFAPGHYRLMRAFVVNTWRPEFDDYLPPHLSGKRTSLDELTEAFDGAVSAGYNILYYSSCSSGAVSNWVGVKAECESKEDLSCPGVPWASTPYVGSSGTCSASGTGFGAYGAEASRAPWRVALDFAIYPEWATKVVIYDREGNADNSVVFNAQQYLNRFAYQYNEHAKPLPDPLSLCTAFDVSHGAPDLTCWGVPNNATANWWASFIAYPTFLGFMAPAEGISEWQAQQWMDAAVGLCDLEKMEGMFCDTSYFGASQTVIATMLLAGTVKKGGPPPPRSDPVVLTDAGNEAVVVKASLLQGGLRANHMEARRPAWLLAGAGVAAVAAVGLSARAWRRSTAHYMQLAAPREPLGC